MGYITEQELSQDIIEKLNNSKQLSEKIAIDKIIDSDGKSIKEKLENATLQYEDHSKQIGNIKNLKTDNKNNLVESINELFTNVDNGKSKLYSAIIDKKSTPKSKDFDALVDGINNIKQTNVPMSDTEILQKVKEKNKFYVKGDYITPKFKINSIKLSNWGEYGDYYKIIKDGIIYNKNNESTLKCDFKGNEIKTINENIYFFCEKYGYSVKDKIITIYDSHFNIIKKGKESENFKNPDDIVGITQNFDIIIEYGIDTPSYLSRYMRKTYFYKKYKMLDIDGNQIWNQYGMIEIPYESTLSRPIYFVNDFKTGKLYYVFQDTEHEPLEVTRENLLKSSSYSSSEYIYVTACIYNGNIYKIIRNAPPNEISVYEKQIFKNGTSYYKEITDSARDRDSKIYCIDDNIYYHYTDKKGGYLYKENDNELYLISNNFYISDVLYYNHLGIITYDKHGIYYNTFGYTLDDNIIIQLPQGNAQTNDVLQGKTFTNDNGKILTGNIPNNGDKVITPSKVVQTLGRGYYNNIKVNPITEQVLKNNNISIYTVEKFDAIIKKDSSSEESAIIKFKQNIDIKSSIVIIESTFGNTTKSFAYSCIQNLISKYTSIKSDSSEYLNYSNNEIYSSDKLTLYMTNDGPTLETIKRSVYDCMHLAIVQRYKRRDSSIINYVKIYNDHCEVTQWQSSLPEDIHLKITCISLK